MIAYGPYRVGGHRGLSNIHTRCFKLVRHQWEAHGLRDKAVSLPRLHGHSHTVDNG